MSETIFLTIFFVKFQMCFGEWEFKVKSRNLLYLRQKRFDCHETKSKHTDWTLGLKWDLRIWPWPWPWPWIFKYGICYLSTKNGLIATKQKANISIKIEASNGTIGFDHGHDLDLEFSRSNMEFAISLLKMVWLPQNKKQTYRLNSWPQMCDHDFERWGVRI